MDTETKPKPRPQPPRTPAQWAEIVRFTGLSDREIVETLQKVRIYVGRSTITELRGAKGAEPRHSVGDALIALARAAA